MKYRLLSLIFLLAVLAGCQREPMIRLSDENKAMVESKRQALTGESQEDETVNEEEFETSLEETTQSQVSISWNKDQWTPVEGNPDLELMDYLPSPAYMIKDFYNGQQLLTTYPMFIDEENQIMQVEHAQSNQSSLVFYNWGSIQIIKLGQIEGLNPYVNHIDSQNNQLTDNELILESPLQIGETWERTPGIESEITAIYRQGKIGDIVYNNIIEVTSQFPEGDQIDYYAQGQGHIGQTNPQNNWQVQGVYPESRINGQINFYLPIAVNGQEKLEANDVNFKWQTNQNPASSFQEILRELEIIDESIQVQDVRYDNDIVYFEFSPGVVAVLNSYDASEYGIIGALVVSLGEFYDSQQVRITVNGNGMLPQTVPYPTNGIYQVDEVRAYFENNQSETTRSQENSNESNETLDLEIPYNEETSIESND